MLSFYLAPLAAAAVVAATAVQGTSMKVEQHSAAKPRPCLGEYYMWNYGGPWEWHIRGTANGVLRLDLD